MNDPSKNSNRPKTGMTKSESVHNELQENIVDRLVGKQQRDLGLVVRVLDNRVQHLQHRRDAGTASHHCDLLLHVWRHTDKVQCSTSKQHTEVQHGKTIKNLKDFKFQCKV